MSNIYLINPASDFPTYFSAEVLAARGFPPATYMADLAIPTVGSLAAPYFEVALCDENLEPINFDHPAEIIGITGKVTQHRRMVAISREFRKRGKTVVIGGPFASLSPELLRPHCDVLVRGEIEEIADQLFSDLSSGHFRDEYQGTKVDLALTPVPLWNKYANRRAMSGTIQTSRGCPFECDFCDVIQYLGRKQRHKPIAHVLRELDALYAVGYRSIFIADDNFTVYRSHAKELLAALHFWNAQHADDPLRFITQVSIDAARDEELLAMCAAAGLRQLFIGIETPNEDSLRGSKKRQNLKGDLATQVSRFVAHGIMVYGGLMVGFDADGKDVFQRQYDFAMSMPIPVYSLGALVAPAATPLHDRLLREGRLVEGPEVAAMPWSTNIAPARMSRTELLDGLKWLCNRLYDPENFGDRIERLLDGLAGQLPQRAAPPRMIAQTDLYQDLRMLVAQMMGMGEAESRLLQRVLGRLSVQKEARYYIYAHLVQYMQIRHMYAYGGVWDSLVSTPPFMSAPSADLGSPAPGRPLEMLAPLSSQLIQLRTKSSA